ncbi:hypothetical protein A3B42_02220 [Candidatus Daviesbacteria bacterium RIFCSPLOWO2_01_FULL_38_10]|uniref:Uncharacterized protein n=1 Tax=Candidatus Daviesbacteria bacterium GW2011_GWF2_38_6 TaxID=1618432 RepID=A0A0G0KU17_9BACT|nr:MAG: hypothetical protein US99_C0004G0007 [Candidatus Daviesbacteria bacterium GW2011_GWF2_38_6]OGE27302.1 MAG: hypothetical protein A3D02_01480 [Candidatus Daviesbacteria bacterium RIFCSPHIGHO2_02_FULL_39_41]OGE28145.1 MAG: hypothetical protein A2772_01025 [Candidatus Daviesbacteria bacterium RIFCSPHIGHO2_01_FULL_38_8b]OGE37632.1 MAG: hypothetical protein A3B42_02220 [Candidatus Daviesbacteria bacterium RIFCSPLOWO2_01_FULL_38_10]OGE45857.1 MAG: hypothetical protein A3E67_03635 [Candidatus D
MTKQNLKKLIKEELEEIKGEYKASIKAGMWSRYVVIARDELEIYNRGHHDAYKYVLSMLDK